MDNFRWLVLEQNRDIVHAGLEKAITQGKIRPHLRNGEFYLLGLVAITGVAEKGIELFRILCIGNTTVGQYEPVPIDSAKSRLETIQLASNYTSAKNFLRSERHPFTNGIWLYSNNIDKQWEVTNRDKALGYYIDLDSVILI